MCMCGVSSSSLDSIPVISPMEWVFQWKKALSGCHNRQHAGAIGQHHVPAGDKHCISTRRDGREARVEQGKQIRTVFVGNQ